MTRTLICALVASVALPAAAVAAQDPPPVPPPVPVTAPPATPTQTDPPASPTTPPPIQQPPAVAPVTPQPSVPAPLDDATVKQRRREIRNMEGVLASAVKGAAIEIAQELESPETGPFQQSGGNAARGFILDGYGVFFHVEIPSVQPLLISPAVLMSLEERLAARRRQAQPEVASSGSVSTVSAPSNRNAIYVERVRDVLMRAMIQYSKPLALQPDEWLTVAASDGDEPMMPGILTEQAIMVLRIRGRDINDYLAERLSLEEVMKRVEVRKF